MPVEDDRGHPVEHFNGHLVLVAESVEHLASHVLQSVVFDIALRILYFVVAFVLDVFGDGFTWASFYVGHTEVALNVANVVLEVLK